MGNFNDKSVRISFARAGGESPGVAVAGHTAGSMPPSAKPFEFRFGVDQAAAWLRREWLLPDGLGGYSMGTALGAATRRYHGLLVQALRPPAGRINAMPTVIETLTVPGAAPMDLSSFRFGDAMVHPRGFERLTSFERSDPFVEDGASVRWRWDVGGARVVRTVRPLWGVGGVRLEYSVTGAAPGSVLAVQPLAALRDFHALLRRGPEFETRVVRAHADGAGPGHVIVARDGLVLHLWRDGGLFVREPDWWTGFRYDREQERRYDCDEDLFTPGRFEATAGADGALALAIAARVAPAGEDPGEGRALLAAPDARTAHLRRISRACPRVAPPLVQAADDFVVPRTVGGRALSTILAGYPWFADWGRDAMISMPGLLVTTGRHEEARALLEAFAGLSRRGILPNCFTDDATAPNYCTVDASMWFLHAVCELAGAAGKEFIGKALLDACRGVIERYTTGTDFGIGVDPADGLVAAGDETTQLTWMDAKRDGVVFTPRNGKPVEINALWVSGLRGVAALVGGAESGVLLARAEAASASFNRLFWRPEIGCLCDRLAPDGSGGWTPIDEVRPNQVFAASLERSPLSIERRRAVTAKVRETLLTPFGLRTLAPGSAGYVARYEGSMFERDRAYHNGTAWPWLLGGYAEGVWRAGGKTTAAAEEARRALAPLLRALERGEGPCIGQAAEIYDAEGDPQRPDGCPAQAWSVAELLRVSALLGGG